MSDGQMVFCAGIGLMVAVLLTDNKPGPLLRIQLWALFLVAMYGIVRLAGWV